MTTKPKVEMLNVGAGESFRFLQWNANDVTDVEALGPDGKAYRYKGAGDTWHCHPGLELVLITQGTGTRLVGDDISMFKAPDLILLGANLPHYWHTEHPLSGYALQFDFGPEHAFWKFRETRNLASLWQNAQQGIRYTGRVVNDVTECIQSMTTCGCVGRLGRLLMILERLHLVPKSQLSLLSQKTFPPSLERSAYRGIQKAITVLLQSYQEDLTLDDVLQVSSMSKATLRQFKRHTGKTFTQFLCEVRMDAAKRQLIETDVSIGEVAFASGFNSLSHFNHEFVNIHGESPSAFRRRMKRV